MKRVVLNSPFTLFLGVFMMCFAFVSCAQNNSPKVENKKQPLTNKTAMKKSEDEWKKQLSSEQYYVLREKGTERAYTGKFNMHFEKGKYTCSGCGSELFDSGSKFESHCGWPSFDKEIANGNIKTITDRSHGMMRTEIICAKCDGHLGHVFEDGPTKTGLRYCVNSLSLKFVPANQVK